MLILAGICNLLTRTGSTLFNTLMFCTNFMIYIGLILFWTQHLIFRLLPTKTRAYMLVSSGFMIIYLLQRVFKYRMVYYSVTMTRYVSYSYFVPMVLVPTVFLMMSVNLVSGNSSKGNMIERIILFLGIIIAVLPLTNDIHGLIYTPTVDIAEFDISSGTYSWGPLFYGIYGWMILALALGIILMFRSTSRKDKKIILYLSLALMVWIGALLINYLVIEPYDLPRMYFYPEINCFCMLLILETSIRTRLIPHNEKYKLFFENLKLPILITNNQLDTANATAINIEASKDVLTKAKNVPVYIDEDTRLAALKIRGGYAFWTENEHEIREERKRLANANELLSEENDLIEVENKLKEQKAHLAAQNRVYERITAAIFPKQKKIEELLEPTDPSAGEFPETIGKACVLNAYSKRKTNLLLLSEESLPESNRELFLALAETCRFLKCCGIEAAAVGDEYTSIPLKAVNDLYDTFETVVETYLPYLSRMTVSIVPAGVRIAMEAREILSLPETSLPVECKESDGILFLTINNGNGGEAA